MSGIVTASLNPSGTGTGPANRAPSMTPNSGNGNGNGNGKQHVIHPGIIGHGIGGSNIITSDDNDLTTRSIRLDLSSVHPSLRRSLLRSIDDNDNLNCN